MFGAKSRFLNYSKRFIKYHNRTRNFSNTNNSNKTPQSINNNDGKLSVQSNIDEYRDLDNLNFTKAAQILFSEPIKKKKFGLDFHLVQLFFALMPSLAVYLVAQYARSEMKRMDAELEVKKKAEEKEKAKKIAEDQAAEVEIALNSNSEILKVKERLEALEDAVKEIAVETKKRSTEVKSKTADQSQESVDPNSKSEQGRSKQSGDPVQEKKKEASNLQNEK